MWSLCQVSDSFHLLIKSLIKSPSNFFFLSLLIFYFIHSLLLKTDTIQAIWKNTESKTGIWTGMEIWLHKIIWILVWFVFVGPCEASFHDKHYFCVVITRKNLFGLRTREKKAKSTSNDTIIGSMLTALNTKIKYLSFELRFSFPDIQS